MRIAFTSVWTGHGPRGILKQPDRGQGREIHGAFAPGWQRERNGSWRMLLHRDRRVCDDAQPVGARPRLPEPGIRRGVPAHGAVCADRGRLRRTVGRRSPRRAGTWREPCRSHPSVARGVVTTPDAPLRDAFYDLDRAALLVRRIGVNLNQAVAKLNATGQPSGDLPRYARETLRSAARLEKLERSFGRKSTPPSARTDDAAT